MKLPVAIPGETIDFWAASEQAQHVDGAKRIKRSLGAVFDSEARERPRCLTTRNALDDARGQIETSAEHKMSQTYMPTGGSNTRVSRADVENFEGREDGSRAREINIETRPSHRRSIWDEYVLELREATGRSKKSSRLDICFILRGVVGEPQHSDAIAEGRAHDGLNDVGGNVARV